MIYIYQEKEKIIACEKFGRVICTGKSRKDDTDIIQHAVDSLKEGGEIKILRGRYTLKKSIIIAYPITISGEGRATVIVPPAGDFAFKVKYEGKCPPRAISNFENPVHGEPGKKWDIDTKNMTLRNSSNKLRLHGVMLKSLAICGKRSGKGIFMANLTESNFKDLWIIGTYDGAALYFGEGVMECDFENIHCENNGSPTKKEASIVIKSQKGDASNNLHFRSLYVIFPQYIGLEIGNNEFPDHPRLIWFENCMYHGWHVLAEPAPFDLIKINKTDYYRGVVFSNSRFTNPGKNKAYFNIKGGCVKINGCFLGGNVSDEIFFIKACNGSRLSITQNTFHSVTNREYYLYAEESEVIFTENEVGVGIKPNNTDVHIQWTV